MSLTIVVASFLEAEQLRRIHDCVPDARILYDPVLLAPPRYAADHTGEPSFRRSPEDETRFRAWLAEADVLYDFDRGLLPELPQLAPKLRWIQATSSGIGKLLESSGLAATDIIVTNAAGIHAIPLAEHSLLAMLYFCKEIPLYRQRQQQHYWERRCGQELRGQTLGVIGLGAVGQEVARLARVCGLYVIGVKRRAAASAAAYQVDEVYTQAALPQVLPRCHYLVLICPHTPETEGLIGADELALLPAGAVLINIGRGALLDEDALLEALEAEHIAGAALDVALREPLPQDSPLWDHPRVLVTPHSASTVKQENERLVTLFCDNLQCFQSGQPLRNLFQGRFP